MVVFSAIAYHGAGVVYNEPPGVALLYIRDPLYQSLVAGNTKKKKTKSISPVTLQQRLFLEDAKLSCLKAVNLPQKV